MLLVISSLRSPTALFLPPFDRGSSQLERSQPSFAKTGSFPPPQHIHTL